MIRPVTVTLAHDGLVEIDSGPFFGHHVGQLKAVTQDGGPTTWLIGGQSYTSLTAAMNKAMALAYEYVAQETELQAHEGR